MTNLILAHSALHRVLVYLLNLNAHNSRSEPISNLGQLQASRKKNRRDPPAPRLLNVERQKQAALRAYWRNKRAETNPLFLCNIEQWGEEGEANLICEDCTRTKKHVYMLDHDGPVHNTKHVY